MISAVIRSLDSRRALILGVVSLAALAVGGWFDHTQFFRSYLLAFLFFLGLSLGSLAIQLLHNLTGGGWGFAIKPILRAGSRTLLLMAPAYVPLVFGIHELYEWSHAEVVAADPVLAHKTPYLNVPFFLGRAAGYWGLWLLIAGIAGALWQCYERTHETARGIRLRRFSAPALAVYCLTMSFAAIDWGMTLEPHWFSTIYGLHFIVGQALSVMALAIVTLHFQMHRPAYQELIQERQILDLGNLLMAFVMLWAYVSFSQYLIIWSGNLPEETPWYLNRTAHGWQAIALTLVVFHFAVPFLLLLSRNNKRYRHRLWKIAAIILALRLADLVWVIVPAFHPDGFSFHVMDLLAILGLGGLWLSLFLRQLTSLADPLAHAGKLRTSYTEAPAT